MLARQRGSTMERPACRARNGDSITGQEIGDEPDCNVWVAGRRDVQRFCNVATQDSLHWRDVTG